MLSEFADFELADESVYNTREDRMRSAFEKSKQSYAEEQVYTESGWYDPPEIPAPTKLHVRNIDYSLNNMYFKGEYKNALDFALSQLANEEASPGGEGRESQLIDTSIRCAIKLKDYNLAGSLADKTREKWASNAGLAVTATEAYIYACRSRDALTSILTVISSRSSSGPFITHLYRSLESLSVTTLKSYKPLQDILSILQPQLPPRDPSYLLPEIDVDTARDWVSACGIQGTEQQVLVSILSRKSADEIEGDIGRSVRSL